MDINALLAQARGGAQSNPTGDTQIADSEFITRFLRLYIAYVYDNQMEKLFTFPA